MSHKAFSNIIAYIVNKVCYAMLTLFFNENCILISYLKTVVLKHTIMIKMFTMFPVLLD